MLERPVELTAESLTPDELKYVETPEMWMGFIPAKEEATLVLKSVDYSKLAEQAKAVRSKDRRQNFVREIRKQILSSSFYRKDKSLPPVCLICANPDARFVKDCGILVWLPHFPDFFAFHEFCLLMAPESFCTSSPSNLEKNMFKISLSSVHQAFKRVILSQFKPTCSYCGLRGAFSGCWMKRCKSAYHLPCAMRLKCPISYTDNSVICPTHTDRTRENQKEILKKIFPDGFLRKTDQKLMDEENCTFKCVFCKGRVQFKAELPWLGYNVVTNCEDKAACYHYACMQDYVRGCEYDARCQVCHIFNRVTKFHEQVAMQGIYVYDSDDDDEDEPSRANINTYSSDSVEFLSSCDEFLRCFDTHDAYYKRDEILLNGKFKRCRVGTADKALTESGNAILNKSLDLLGEHHSLANNAYATHEDLFVEESDDEFGKMELLPIREELVDWTVANEEEVQSAIGQACIIKMVDQPESAIPGSNVDDSDRMNCDQNEDLKISTNTAVDSIGYAHSSEDIESENEIDPILRKKESFFYGSEVSPSFTKNRSARDNFEQISNIGPIDPVRRDLFFTETYPTVNISDSGESDEYILDENMEVDSDDSECIFLGRPKRRTYTTRKAEEDHLVERKSGSSPTKIEVNEKPGTQFDGMKPEVNQSEFKLLDVRELGVKELKRKETEAEQGETKQFNGLVSASESSAKTPFIFFHRIKYLILKCVDICTKDFQHIMSNAEKERLIRAYECTRGRCTKLMVLKGYNRNILTPVSIAVPNVKKAILTSEAVMNLYLRLFQIFARIEEHCKILKQFDTTPSDFSEVDHALRLLEHSFMNFINES